MDQTKGQSVTDVPGQVLLAGDVNLDILEIVAQYE